MPDAKRKSLLLVEDEPVTALLEKEQLQSYGYSVNHVETGEEAVELIRKKKELIDLVLMDIDLGDGIDGTEAARQILEHIDIPIVFLSSHTEPEIVKKTEMITSYGYVTKQSTITVLDASIKMAFKLFKAKILDQKKEEALQQSEDKFAKAFKANESLMAISTYKEGRFIDVNDKFLGVLGFEYDEVIGRTSGELNFFADLEKLEEFLKLIGQNRSFENLEIKVRTKSGDILYGLFSVSVITILNKKYWLTVLNDITDVKKSRLKLSLANEQLKATLNALPDLMLEIDSNGLILDYRASKSENLFINPDDFIGKNLNEILPEDAAIVINKGMSAALEKGEHYGSIYSLDMPDGKMWYEISIARKGKADGSGISFIALCRDITDRKKAEEQLKVSKNLL